MTLKGSRLVNGQWIQWHLRTTKHDKCPNCGGPLGYLSQKKRMCLGKCKDGTAWNLEGTVKQWLRSVGR